jgi:hypothetical protein
LTLLVRVPHHPDLIRAFTEAERQHAEDHAREHGGIVETLALQPPPSMRSEAIAPME